MTVIVTQLMFNSLINLLGMTNNVGLTFSVGEYVWYSLIYMYSVLFGIQ